MLEPETVRLAGGRTWRVWRGGRGPDIVWFHGIFGAAPADPFLARLVERYRVIAPVAPGYTDLDELADIGDVHDLALAYDDLLAALRLQQPALVGHSYGAMIAAEVAAHVPASAPRLVLMAPFGLWAETAPVADLFAAAPMDQLLWHDKAAQEQFQAAMSGADGTEDVERAVAAARRLSAAAKFLWPIPDKGLRRRLPRIAAPVLLLFGAEDQVIPSGHAELFRAALRRAEAAVIPDAGHMLPYESPDLVLARLTRFVEKQQD